MFAMQTFLIHTLVFLTSFASACIYKREAGSTVWSYTGDTGPLLWHKLNETNFACAHGKQQSPINIESDSTTTGNVSLAEYPAFAEFKIENNGHTIELTPNGNLTAELGGEDYTLLQFHFHTPSEHRLNREHFPLEVHFVHQSLKTGAIAVVGILFDVSTCSDPFLAGMALESVTQITETADPPQTQEVCLSSIKTLTQGSKIYTYSGSLTTPPCSEAVTWFFVEEPLAVSVDQYKSFKDIMKFNSRYTQNELHSPPDDNLIQDACR